MEEKEKTQEELLSEVSELRQQLDALKEQLSGKQYDNGEAIRKLPFVKTVSDIASQFIAVSDIDDGITTSLEKIGRTSGADRAYVFLVSKDGATMSNTHEWVRAGVSPEKDNLRDLPVETFAWSMARLRNGETIHVEDVAALPEEAFTERDIFQAQHIKSLLIFPMEAGRQFLGFMGLDNVKETGKWGDEPFELLKVSAKIVGDALLRSRMDRTLLEQTRALGERVKELNCLLGISQIFENTKLSIGETVQEVVNLIPRSWRCPEVTCARIILMDKEYRTPNFKETRWKQASEIKIYGESRGMVEVYYLEEESEKDEGVFLKEERRLIDGVARVLGRLSERKQAEKELRESEAEIRALLNAIPDLKFRIDRTGTFLEFIPAKESEPALPASEFLGKRVFDVLPAGIAEQTMLRMERALETGNIQLFEYRLPTPFPDGNLRDYEARLVASGEDEVIAIVRDITEKKKAEDRLRMLATMDSLTEVLNRRSGLLLLRKQLQFSKRNNAELSICYVDINDLKEINDTYGHREGDEVLRGVARILKEEVRESDAVCRLGGDEFLIILPQCSLDKAGEVWFRIAARLKALNAIKMNPYKISLSHGFADFEPANPSSIDEMLIVADFEMYKDKRSILGDNQPPKNP